MPVRVTKLTREDVDEIIDLTGTAQPWDEFRISSEIPGRVTQLYVNEGDWVERGQLLLELERERRQIDLESRKADLTRSKVVLEFSRKRLERGQSLLEKGAMSQSEVDTLDQAVQVAESAVRVSEISIQSIEEELEDTQIHAPAAGQISVRHISRGETVTPSTPLMTVIQVNPIKVMTEISEPYLYKVRQGQRVRLIFESVNSSELTGTIHFIHPVANPVSSSFPTEIRLNNARRRLQPGMVARVLVKAETLRDVLLAPLDAIVDFDGQFFVFVVEGEVVSRRPVEIVRRLGARAVVAGPLKAGDLLVVTGNANLTEGTSVEIVS
jgi:membrane fusion protein (multidrug efflux system)